MANAWTKHCPNCTNSGPGQPTLLVRRPCSVCELEHQLSAQHLRRPISRHSHFFLPPASSSARWSGSAAYLPNSIEKLALPLDMPRRSPMYENISDSGTNDVISLTFPRSPM